MFNYYSTKPPVKAAGFSSYQEFVSKYLENEACVEDGDMAEDDFNLWLKPVRDALGGIDIGQVISASRWSVGTILLGLYTFMLDPSEQPTYGSITTTSQDKQRFASESLEYNVKNQTFCELFPDLVELHEERKKTAPPPSVAAVSSSVTQDKSPQASWTTILGILAAVVACTWALLSMSL
eukprot:gene16667-11927_t